MIYFGLPLRFSQKLPCIWEEKVFALFAMDSYNWRWGLDRSGHVLLHVFVVWQMSRWFGDRTRFLENLTGGTVLAFFRRSHLSESSFTLTTCLLGISPLEPDTVLGVTLQACRAGAMEIYSPSARGSVPSFLAPLCLWLSQWWHQSYCCLYPLIYPPSRSWIIGT